jgi:hypothetical protein
MTTLAAEPRTEHAYENSLGLRRGSRVILEHGTEMVFYEERRIEGTNNLWLTFLGRSTNWPDKMRKLDMQGSGLFYNGEGKLCYDKSNGCWKDEVKDLNGDEESRLFKWSEL